MASEIRAMAATGVMTGGVLVRVAPPDGTFPQLYEEHWEPVWAAAAEVGYPVTTHGGNAPIYAPGSGKLYPRGRPNGPAPPPTQAARVFFCRTK
ncbi:MAG: hypothetical protein OXN95_08025, partial [bacterium]|nr:hypothetical protein [bacterium]